MWPAARKSFKSWWRHRLRSRKKRRASELLLKRRISNELSAKIDFDNSDASRLSDARKPHESRRRQTSERLDQSREPSAKLRDRSGRSRKTWRQGRRLHQGRRRRLRGFLYPDAVVQSE